MANDKFPLIVNPADVSGTALSKVVQLQPTDKLSPDSLPVMVGDTGSGGTAGIVPAPAAGDAAAGKYLDADGTWSIPAGGGGGGSGDVTGPVTSTAGNVPTWQDTTGEVLSDGFPVSAAAKTVLDDSTVSAMVDTLGGASATGSGGLVRATSPALVTPNIGVATATSVNKVAVTAPAASATLTIADGATLTASATASVSGTNSGDVALAGTPDYITISGQTITRGQVDLAADVTGILPHGNLGTGGGGSTKFLREDSTFQTIPGGGDALTSGTLAQFAATTSAELRGVLSDETGTGAAVFATSPTLVTPALGTPSAVVLTNATGLPTAGLVDGAVTFAKMQAVSADVLLGNDASGTAVEEIACTAAGRALLDDANAAAQRTTLGLGTLAVENTAPIAQGGTGQTSQTAGFNALSPTTTKGDLIVDNGTDAVRLPVGGTNGHVLTVDSAEATGVKWAAAAGGGDALTSGTLAQFAATTSAELRGVLSDETGTGAAVFATSPTLVTPILGTPTSGTLTNCTGLPTGGVTVSATDRLLGRVSASAGVAEEIPITDFVQTILDDADAAAVRTTIGAGTGSGDALTSGTLAQFAATTSAQLRGVLSDEVGGGGKALFADALDMVPTANQRNPEWDQVRYGWRKNAGVTGIEAWGQRHGYMLDGKMTDSPGNGGSWLAIDAGTAARGGLFTAFNVVQTRWSPELLFAIKTGASLTGVRFWIGISASYLGGTAPVADGGTFSIASAAFAWDATVHSGSNFWRAHTSDGSGASGATVTTTSTAIATSTTYNLRVKANPGSNVLFYINDTLVATHTTDLPSVSAAMGITLGIFGANTTFEWKRVVVQHD